MRHCDVNTLRLNCNSRTSACVNNELLARLYINNTSFAIVFDEFLFSLARSFFFFGTGKSTLELSQKLPRDIIWKLLVNSIDSIDQTSGLRVDDMFARYLKNNHLDDATTSKLFVFTYCSCAVCWPVQHSTDGAIGGRQKNGTFNKGQLSVWHWKQGDWRRP